MSCENILTVDVEDWFHICGVEELIPEATWPQLESRVTINTVKILEVLSKRKIKATFFVLGFIAERYPELVKNIAEEGHEISIHGYSHQRVYTMTPDLFRQDIRKAVEIISTIIKSPVKGYRAPEWSIRNDSLWALDILQQEGFIYDSSLAPLPIIGNPRYDKVPTHLQLAQGRLWEFPPLVAATGVVNVPIGGGWGLRTFPYWLIRSTIGKINSQGHPALIYLHPREFDSCCPSIKLPWIKKFVLQAGVESTEKRVARLLDDFHFTSISAALSKTILTNNASWL